jgi:hypothetical protein
MSITDMLDRTFYLYKQSFTTNLAYLILYKIIMGVCLGAIAFIVVIPMMIGTVMSEITGRLSTSMIVLTVIFAIVVFIFSFSIAFLQYGGIIEIASNTYLDKKISPIKILGNTFKNMPKILSVMIAGAVIVLPGLLLFGGGIAGIIYGLKQAGEMMDPRPLISLGIGFSPYQIFGLIGIFILGLGLLAFIIYIGVIFGFAVQAAVLEDMYFFKALWRSKQLINGEFWRIFAKRFLWMLVNSAIVYSVLSLIGLFVGMFYLLLKFLNVPDETLVLMYPLFQIVQYPVRIIFSILFEPVSVIFPTLLYYNQRFKREGYDIELEMERIKEQKKGETRQ